MKWERRASFAELMESGLMLRRDGVRRYFKRAASEGTLENFVCKQNKSIKKLVAFHQVIIRNRMSYTQFTSRKQKSVFKLL